MYVHESIYKLLFESRFERYYLIKTVYKLLFTKPARSVLLILIIVKYKTTAIKNSGSDSRAVDQGCKQRTFVAGFILSFDQKQKNLSS